MPGTGAPSTSPSVTPFVLGWGSPFDADNDTYRLFTTNGSVNYGAYSNQTVDETLTRARVTADKKERYDAYKTSQKCRRRTRPTTLSAT